jgi:prolyl oligopeptidase
VKKIRVHRTLALVAIVAVATIGPAAATQPAASPQLSASPVAATSAIPSAGATEAADPYLWLEDVRSPRAMAWVEAENAKSLGVLEGDRRFNGLYADALKIAEAKDRIPAPSFAAGDIYNFWQDADHVRGIWRYTTPAGYLSSKPHWKTALDLDALAKSQHANWVWEGASCVWPAERRCMVYLSDGGEDAYTAREFDVSTQSFVRGGFDLPRGKQDVAWQDQGTLFVAREWQPGELTASGYPYVVKRLRRGNPLSSAVEVFRGAKSDVGVNTTVYNDVQNEQAVIIDRALTFFTSEKYLVTARGVRRLNVPSKVSTTALVDGRLLFTLAQDWTTGGETFAAGSLVSVDLAALKSDPEHLKPELVYAPGPRDSLGDVGTTHSQVIVTTYHNVRGRAFVYTPLPNGGWSSRFLDLPDNATISLEDADAHGDAAFLGVTSFLSPTTLWLANTRSDSLTIAKQLPARFDASKDVVEQREATSKDGTQIPYFIVHPKTMPLDGSNPTILNAYGGFQVSLTPTYSGLVGKLWLERGGVYVVANIRGGGEFGPAWHEAGLGMHRQRIYDDFAAVAEDLIASKVTSPSHLGIEGGSNGGLLMGVEFTQHPELWNAVDMQVPLLDMLRYEKIAAGASWVGEYGSVAVPAERAFLASISPYNNLKPGVKYPEPLIWTTTKDDRVGPQHARKFAARLAEMHIPYLYYEVTEGGHGSGANLNERAHTTALEMTYFIRQLFPLSP